MKEGMAMKMTKWLAVLASVALFVSLVPLSAAAATTTVSTPEQLIAALADGGDITLSASLTVMNQQLTVTKDTTLNLGESNALYVDRMMPGEPPQPGEPWPFPEAAIVVKDGATLTINCDNDEYTGLRFAGTGSIVKLVGAADKASTLIINGGNHQASGTYVNPDGFSELYPTSMFAVEAPAGTVKPSVIINGGKVSCATLNASKGPFLSGDACALTVKQGEFPIDPQAYVAEGSVSYFDGWDSYMVLDTSMEISAEFSTLLTDGKLVMNRVEPADEISLSSLFDSMYFDYGIWAEEERDVYFDFHTATYDEQAHTIYVSRVEPCEGDAFGNLIIVETHQVPISFVWDAAIKEKMDAVINTMPESTTYEDEWGEWTEPYYFKVTDLEFINYLANVKNDEYTSLLINYSAEFKELTGYKNFVLDTRMGTADLLSIQAAGFAEFRYNGTVYGVKELGARAEQVLYVADDTPDTQTALLAAAQKRIDEYIGAGKITLVAKGTVQEYIQQMAYEGSRPVWSVEWKPDATFEEWLDSEYGLLPEDIVLEDWTVLKDVTLDTQLVMATVGESEWAFLIKRDSAKMTAAPAYKTVDFGTSITVSAQDSSIPLDTVVNVEQLTAGEVYDNIIKVLDVKENVTYDIKLHSGSTQKYISTLSNGKFEVKLPVPAAFEGKELKVYYVGADDAVEEYAVTVKDGYATFVTDHFSVYTLAPVTVEEQQKPTEPKPEESKPEDSKPTEPKPEESNPETEIVVTVPQGNTAAEVAKTVITQAIAAEKPLVVKSNKDVIATFDTKALETIAANAADGAIVRIQVDAADKDVLNAKQKQALEALDVPYLLSASVFVGDKEVKDFKGGKVTVAIPFWPADGTMLEEYTVVYLRDDGAVEIVPTTAEKHYLTVTIEHFSEYAVAKAATVEKLLADNKPEDVVSPPTGDSTMAGAWLLVCSAALTGVVFSRKKRLVK